MFLRFVLYNFVREIFHPNGFCCCDFCVHFCADTFAFSRSDLLAFILPFCAILFYTQKHVGDSDLQVCWLIRKVDVALVMEVSRDSHPTHIERNFTVLLNFHRVSTIANICSP